jgi:anti-anti-sigma factor
MEYNCRTVDNALEAALAGKLTFDDQNLFRQMLSEMSDGAEARWVIDLSRLEFIDSAGLGLLLRAKAASEQAGKTVAIRVPNEGAVRNMLNVSRFDQLFPFE